VKSTCVLVVWLSLYSPVLAAAQEVVATAQIVEGAAQEVVPRAQKVEGAAQEVVSTAQNVMAAAREAVTTAQHVSAAAPDEGLAAAQETGAVRTMDPPAAEALDYGLRGSQAFRDLVAEVDGSGVIVHVVTGDTVLFGTAGTTRLAGVVGGWRYLRVVLRTHLAMDERASVLAHELHHVLEIARSSAVTQHAVRVLYGDIGRPVPGMHNAFETADASDAGMRVWRELRSAGREAGRQTGRQAGRQTASHPQH